MAIKGQIIEWNDEKGYGFISAIGGELKVFFHISSVTNRGYRPKIKDSVTFDVAEDKKGRFNAENVVVLGVHGFPFTVLFGLSFLVAATASVVLFDGAKILIPLYVVLSMFTYLMFAKDKQAAQENIGERQKTPCIYSHYSVVGLGHCWLNFRCDTNRKNSLSNSFYG